MSLRIVHLNLDTVIAAYERRPASKARARAWEWLAEQTRVTFSGPALFAPSATWSSTLYIATPEHCNCKAKGACWHMEAAQIVADAIAEDAAYDLAADNVAWQAAYDASPSEYHAIAHHEASEAVRIARAERKAKARADVMELFA